MPREYTKIRDALVARGKEYNAAQSEAAAIYNKRHPGNPMGPEDRRDMPHHMRMKKRRKK